MLSIEFIRENSDLIKKALQNKKFECDIDRLLEVDQRRRDLIPHIEELRALKNKVSKEIPTLPNDQKQAKVAEMKQVSDELKTLEPELQEIEAEFDLLMLQVVQVPAADVPVGKDESENVLVREWGTVPTFDFEVKSHIDLALDLNIVEFERAAKIAGGRAYMLKNEGLLLERAVLNYALDFIREKGFEIMSVPHLVRERAMIGTGYYPFGTEDAYQTAKDDLHLIGTAEVVLTSFFMDEILDLDDAPRKIAGISPCYRREAGSYGKDTKGLYRIHQFNKVEQVVFCKPEDSIKLHQYILNNAEEFLQSLELPYRVMQLCTGDLGPGQVEKFDIETYMPSREGYGETHSASRFHDFQSRRLNIRYRDKDVKMQFVHTLNNTVIATPRILIPLLENNQLADGSVKIPKALHPYMGGITEIKTN